MRTVRPVIAIQSIVVFVFVVVIIIIIVIINQSLLIIIIIMSCISYGALHLKLSSTLHCLARLTTLHRVRHVLYFEQLREFTIQWVFWGALSVVTTRSHAQRLTPGTTSSQCWRKPKGPFTPSASTSVDGRRRT